MSETSDASRQVLRILCVDDEKGMGLAICRALDGFTGTFPDVEGPVQFTTEFAVTGEEALRAIDSDPPQILLLDYKLPGITGLDVLKVIESEQLDLIPIMITAYASIETAIAATKHGAFDFLAKPFTPDELKVVIRKAAAHWLLKQQAKKLSEEKRRVRFEMISVVAHELKAPLNAVQGYLDIIQSGAAGPDPKTTEQIVDRCLVRIQGMRKLIVDLLDLTRIESGQKVRRLKMMDVAALARSMVREFEPEASRKKIALTAQAPETLSIVCDPDEIAIVLSNLLSNALKYNRPGGKATVRVFENEDCVIIEAVDTGIGFSTEEAARLFEEFGRIRNEKTKDILGSGLGLSIVKRIAALYGGAVSARGIPDQGSTFTVTLPKSQGEKK